MGVVRKRCAVAATLLAAASGVLVALLLLAAAAAFWLLPGRRGPRARRRFRTATLGLGLTGVAAALTAFGVASGDAGWVAWRAGPVRPPRDSTPPALGDVYCVRWLRLLGPEFWVPPLAGAEPLCGHWFLEVEHADRSLSTFGASVRRGLAGVPEAERVLDLQAPDEAALHVARRLSKCRGDSRCLAAEQLRCQGFFEGPPGTGVRGQAVVSLRTGEAYAGRLDPDRLWILQWIARRADRGPGVNGGFSSAPMNQPLNLLADYVPAVLRGSGPDELFNCQTFAGRFHTDPKGLRTLLTLRDEALTAPAAPAAAANP